ncbi:MAG: hypothetical protein H5T64_02310 [Chloroflexi bacterium]|nr:hypothetical protein [Chloroflexota bacterium]
MKRPDGILVISIYQWVIGAVCLFAICGLGFLLLIMGAVLTEEPDARIPMAVLATVVVFGAGLLLLYGLAQVIAGWGLYHMKPWGRILTIILSVLRLLNFPVGTIIGGAIIYYLVRPEIEAMFKGD